METENLPVAETKAKKRMPKPLARTLSFLGVTLLCALVTLLGVIWVLEKGPSPTATGIFTRSV